MPTISKHRRILAPQAVTIQRWKQMWSVATALVVVLLAHGQGLPVASLQNVGLAPTALDRIAPAMQAYLDSGKYAGAVLVISRYGKIGFSQSIGYMDLEKKILMQTNAVFRIASMTKPIIAAAILQLIDKGKVRLDDPVAKHIPAFVHLRVSGGRGQAASRPPKRQMTVKDLLIHTSGLVGYGEAVAALRPPGRTLAEFADTLAKLPLITSPGDKWDYSSLGYDLLGRVIEVVSGQSLDQYLNEMIFTPLGMRETSFHLSPAIEGRIPVVYSRGQDGTLSRDADQRMTTYLPTTRFLSGGGGLLSTPADYLRFAQMMLSGGKLDGKRILSRASVTTMMRNHLSPSLTPLVTPVFDHAGYGFGLGGAVLVDLPLSGEPGSLGIYRWAGSMQTFFWIDPQKDLIAMLFTQSRTGGYQMERAFQKLVYAAVLP